MIYVERPAPRGLDGVVRRLWFLRMPRVRRYEKILPLPWVHVIANLSAPYRLFDRVGEGTTVDDTFVSGLQTDYLVIELPDVVQHVGVELEPDAVSRVSEVRSSDLAGRIAAVDTVLPGLGALRGALGARPSPDHALDALEECIAAAWTPPTQGDPLVHRALTLLRSESAPRIGAIVDDLGVSHRAFIARFTSAVGIGPKAYAQLWRFHRLIDEADRGSMAPDWAQIVAESPYYDQAHAIRAFRRFTGWTPAEYRRRVAEHGPAEARFVPLDEIPEGARPDQPASA